MSIQVSVAVQNGILNSIPSTIGASPLLRLYTGAPPANCAASESGMLLTTLTLPSTWMGSASGDSEAMSGTWSQPSAVAAGTAAHYRIYDSTGTTCHIQGTVTATGGGGDMTLDNPVLAVGQTVTISSFTLAAANS